VILLHFVSPKCPPVTHALLGCKTLKLAADGSLTIYVQADSPGNDKESSWLPAPKKGEFSLYVRAYWPKAAITYGSWTPPPVQRVN
jgi:hypothetical protein